MREGPILFSGPMVRKILDGRKTQTRRLVQPQPQPYLERSMQWGYAIGAPRPTSPRLVTWRPDGTPVPPIAEYCPYGAPGDRLWVRETWAQSKGNGHRTLYRADLDTDRWPPSVERPDDRIRCWRPSIHMPRAASRFSLEIIDARVERLQEITEADARAEGVRACDRCSGTGIDPVRVGHDPDWCEECGGASQGTTARDVFARLWDEINARRAPWVVNPWVWVVAFRRTEEPAR